MGKRGQRYYGKGLHAHREREGDEEVRGNAVFIFHAVYVAVGTWCFFAAVRYRISLFALQHRCRLEY
jgi:hypothetical protein